MHKFGVLDTFGAVVPIRAGEALVADTEDWLVTAITEGGVLDIASRSTEELGKWAEGVFSNSLEGMSWVMTMLVGFMARNAEIEVIAVNACHKLVLSIF
jgi:hypothetical protein